MYQYDKGGNRVSEKIYNYTLTDTLGTVKQEIVSEYDNLVWDDLLTSYNGKAITYDNAGNPLTYDGKTFVWGGKQLKEIVAQDGSKTVFDYDANGIRTRKIQYNAEGGIDYFVDYVWSDGKIVSQLLIATLRGTSNNEPIEVAIGPIASKVVYDDNGIPQGFTCGSACFGFVRNLQGDAIALVDYDGNIVAEYSYDPWGNIEYHISEDVNEVEALIITALCPLTYRGYNYDFTTGLYYLQSRYYNPEWGRFLNCDDTAILLSTQGQTHNANLFAYCANNPVNKSDETGYWAEDVHNGYFSEYSIFRANKYKYHGNGYIAYNKEIYDRNLNSNNPEDAFYGTYWWAIKSNFTHEHAKLIGESCYEVDSEFSPVNPSTQGWHFNVSKPGETDSRIIIMTFMLIAAYSYFDEALKYNENSKKYNDYLKEGLKYLGYALHPIQDYYAHTDDRVGNLYIPINMTQSLILKYHSPFDGTDSARKRWGQVQKTATITKKILAETYKLYGTLFGG